MAKLARPAGKRNIPEAEDRNAPKPLEVKSVVEGGKIEIPSVEKPRVVKRKPLKEEKGEEKELNVSEAELQEEFEKALDELNSASEGMPDMKSDGVKTSRVKVSVPVTRAQRTEQGTEQNTDKGTGQKTDADIRKILIGLLESDPDVRASIASLIKVTKRSEAERTSSDDAEKEKESGWRKSFLPLKKGMPLEDEIIRWLEERGVPGISLRFDETLYAKCEDAEAVNVVWVKDGTPVCQVRVPVDGLFREFR